MLEIPESKTIGNQANNTLKGKKVKAVVPATSPHKFAFFNGHPEGYHELLRGREITSARGHGMFADIRFGSDTCLTISDGTNMRYCPEPGDFPEKHQMMILFTDGSGISFTVAMYGGIWAYSGVFDNPYHKRSLACVSPLDDAFDEKYFEGIIRGTTRDLSAKALLATEQRIPGLGNGVLQDILFLAGILPKRKRSTFSDADRSALFSSLKTTLKKMTGLGGRDTEKDLFGNNGGYKTLLSKNTVLDPCPGCGGKIVKEAYMGGAVYFCPVCQKL